MLALVLWRPRKERSVSPQIHPKRSLPSWLSEGIGPNDPSGGGRTVVAENESAGQLALRGGRTDRRLPCFPMQSGQSPGLGAPAADNQGNFMFHVKQP